MLPSTLPLAAEVPPELAAGSRWPGRWLAVGLHGRPPQPVCDNGLARWPAGAAVWEQLTDAADLRAGQWYVADLLELQLFAVSEAEAHWMITAQHCPAVVDVGEVPGLLVQLADDAQAARRPASD